MGQVAAGHKQRQWRNCMEDNLILSCVRLPAAIVERFCVRSRAALLLMQCTPGLVQSAVVGTGAVARSGATRVAGGTAEAAINDVGLSESVWCAGPDCARQLPVQLRLR
jgi:hypothetical protein